MVQNMVLGIEDLSSKRDELQQQILLEEEEKQKIQNDIRILTERLAQVNEGLAHKISTRNDYDRTIAECETAYKKVLYIIPIMEFNCRTLFHQYYWSSLWLRVRLHILHKSIITPT